MAEEVVIRPPLITLQSVADSLDRLWVKATEMQDLLTDINTRLTDFEHFLARLALPIVPTPPTLPEYFPRESRWVLEVFPDEVTQWREAIARIPRERLSEKERSFLSSMDYYIVSERKLTLPQLAWLSAVIERVGDRLPEVPMRSKTSSSKRKSHHSNPKCKVCGREIPKGWNFCPKCHVPIVR